MNLVWFKRDLRLRDHLPLRRASQLGPVILFYAYEDDILAGEDVHASHVRFINESLRELGDQLVIRRGRLPDLFDELHTRTGFSAIWAHEETGNARTYARDERVRASHATSGSAPGRGAKASPSTSSRRAAWSARYATATAGRGTGTSGCPHRSMSRGRSTP
ncbi:MAG: deoxyribodipyrimidine photo-lyase [Planctomycetota bacterium]